MTEPAREGRVLALLEAEIRAADPGLTAQFDAFASRRPALGGPPQWDAGQDHGRALPKRLLAFLLVALTVITVLIVLSGSRKAVIGRLPCPPSAALGHPPLAGTGCTAAGQPRGPVPVPAHVRPAAGTRDHIFAAVAHADGNGAPAPPTRTPGGAAGLERQLVTTVEMWVARQGRTIRAQLCRSIPVPAGTACR
jgi:hypothetical protein